MTKEQMLEALESAHQTHQQQMEKIRTVIEGKEIENPPAIGKMECVCGSWFYAHVDAMKRILGLQLFERLDSAHEAWHRDYVNIYNIYFKEEKKGFFSKLLGANKVDPLQQDKAKLYFIELEKDSEELLSASASAQRRVTALSDSKFDSL